MKHYIQCFEIRPGSTVKPENPGLNMYFGLVFKKNSIFKNSIKPTKKPR